MGGRITASSVDLDDGVAAPHGIEPIKSLKICSYALEDTGDDQPPERSSGDYFEKFLPLVISKVFDVQDEMNTTQGVYGTT